jgi:TolA-binding protein
MSLIKVHEYLTKQQHPSSTMTNIEQLVPSSTPPIHHQSYSTLTSVTYRSSIAKQALASGPPISTPSHTSFSSSENPINHIQQDENERRNSLISDIHHLTRSPNTFETSMTSNSSSNSNKHQDTLSYLIEQNQRAMQRLISNHNHNLTEESTRLYSSPSMRAADYESGQLTTMNTVISNEKVQQKSTLIETGSLSTVDFPSAILHAEEQILFQTAQLDCKVRQILILIISFF